MKVVGRRGWFRSVCFGYLPPRHRLSVFWRGLGFHQATEGWFWQFGVSPDTALTDLSVIFTVWRWLATEASVDR